MDGQPNGNDLTLGTPEDVMRDALQSRVRVFRHDPALVLDFDNGQFNQHMVSDDQARQVTVEATETAAAEFGKTLQTAGRQIVRTSITVDTGYGDAIGVMRQAIVEGAV
ncbi:MAG TPA: hypothetical protein VE961_09050 [Pyrinomonadaceae bacterium]|nr:hypothetical protein [Pyrinomonadaceae bacterium]